jgi:hypothetical protein
MGGSHVQAEQAASANTYRVVVFVGRGRPDRVIAQGLRKEQAEAIKERLAWDTRYCLLYVTIEEEASTEKVEASKGG